MKIGMKLTYNPDPSAIRKNIKDIYEAGFEHIEFALDMIPLIVGGEISWDWLNYLKNLFNEFPVTFSAHIGYGLDCRSRDNYNIHKAVLESSVKAAGELGMNPLVLHYEERSDSSELEELFYKAHYDAAIAAENFDLELCIENIEVEYVDPVIDFVKRINRPNFKMTYDLGHGYLASKYLGFDYFESIRKSIPVLGHIHMSDNTGTFEMLRVTERLTYDKLPLGYRFSFGRGDIHIPPLWGNLPYKEISEILTNYDGLGVCEFYSDFYKPFLGKIYSDINKLFNTDKPKMEI